MLLESILLENFLSYGTPAEEVRLKEFDVIIGPSRSVKSHVSKKIPLIHSLHTSEKSSLLVATRIVNGVWNHYRPVPAERIDRTSPQNSRAQRGQTVGTQQARVGHLRKRRTLRRTAPKN